MRLDDKDAIEDREIRSDGTWLPRDDWRRRDLLPCRRRAEGQLHRLGELPPSGEGLQHAEAFGLFTGGRELSDAAKQTYLYFEVRQDGMYYIAHRSGANVHKLVDWTASPAIHKFDDTPNATNDLAIKVAADSVRFFVNNTQVNAVPRSGMSGDESGDVGLRVNHNLSVHVASFTVKPGAK